MNKRQRKKEIKKVSLHEKIVCIIFIFYYFGLKKNKDIIELNNQFSNEFGYDLFPITKCEKFEQIHKIIIKDTKEILQDEIAIRFILEKKLLRFLSEIEKDFVGKFISTKLKK